MVGDDEDTLAASVTKAEDPAVDTDLADLEGSLAALVGGGESSNKLASAYDKYAKYLADQRRDMTTREKLRAMAAGLAMPTYGTGMRGTLANMASSFGEAVTKREEERKAAEAADAKWTFDRDVALANDETKRTSLRATIASRLRQAELAKAAKDDKATGFKRLKTDINPVTGKPYSAMHNRDVPPGFVNTTWGVMSAARAEALERAAAEGRMPARDGTSQPGAEASAASSDAPPIDPEYGDAYTPKPLARSEALKYGYFNGYFDPKGEFHGVNKAPEPGVVKTHLAGLRREAAQKRQLVAQVNDALADINSYTTGLGGAAAKSLPGTQAYRLAQRLKTMGANAAFDALQQMRASSPTGGALGQVTERELELLMNAKTTLSQKQKPEEVYAAFREFAKHYNGLVDALENEAIPQAQALYDELVAASGAPAPLRSSAPKPAAAAPKPAAAAPKPAANAPTSKMPSADLRAVLTGGRP